MPNRIVTSIRLILYAVVFWSRFHSINSFLVSNHRSGHQKCQWPCPYDVKRKHTEKSKNWKHSPFHSRKHELYLRGGSNIDGKGKDLSIPESVAAAVKQEKKGNLVNNDLSLRQRSVTLFSSIQENLFLGIKPTPEILAIVTIYFVEGALSLAGLAQTFILKDELSLGPAEMAAVSGLLVVPWTIKPIYGFLSDVFPLFGYRRRSYLVVAGCLGFLCYSSLGHDISGVVLDSISNTAPLAKQGLIIVPLLLASACIALSDVVADGIVVERTRDSTDPQIAGGLQSLCWGAAALGGLVSSYFSGSLLEIMTPRDVFSITAFLPLLVAGIALLIDEDYVVKGDAGGKRSKQDEGEIQSGDQNGTIALIQQQTRALWVALKDPLVWKPALFLFIWQSTPTSEGAFFYFITNDLGIGPEFLGRVGLISSIFSLIGIWCYQTYLTRVAIKDILFWTSIISVILGLLDLVLITHTNRVIGIPDGAFIFGDDAASSVLGQIAFLPTLVLAAKICPPGVEAVLFATLMSIFNFSSVVGTEIGAFLTKLLHVTENDFENMGLLSLICNVTSLYPILFLGWLDDIRGLEDLEETKGESQSDE